MKVKSSAFSDIEYDPATQTLTVEFASGQRHQFREVPEHIHQQLMESPSLGKAFHELVRNKFPSSKLA